MRCAAGVVAVAVMAMSSGSWADVLRCGTGIVETGVSTAELVAQCGEPDSKSFQGMNWTYSIDGQRYEVRVSDDGVVAEIKQVGE